ncbi:MAG: hypothetical protein H7315_19605 [Herminiimonas sp.]|nr:hypothetical protein [Herminiimonas sp.]
MAFAYSILGLFHVKAVPEDLHRVVLLPLAQLTQPNARMTQPLRSTAVTAASTLLRAAPSLVGASLFSGLRLSLRIATEGSRSSA